MHHVGSTLSQDPSQRRNGKYKTKKYKIFSNCLLTESEALLYWPSDSKDNVSRLKSDILRKTKRSSLNKYSVNGNNSDQVEILYFAHR